MKFDEFFSDTQRDAAKFADWRSDRKIVFFLHPRSEIGKQVRITARQASKNDSGDSIITPVFRLYEGEDKKTVDTFKQWLSKNDNVDNNDVVFRISAGGVSEEYKKGDLLNVKGFNWQKQLLDPRVSYLFCIITVDNPSQLVLNLPKSAGKKMAKKINSQIAEYDIEGDPFRNPWAIMVTYDPSAQGKDKYDVERHMAQPQDQHRALFDEDPDDILSICKTQENGPSMEELLKGMLAIPCELFDKDLVDETPKKTVVKKNAAKSVAAKQSLQKTMSVENQQISDEQVVVESKPQVPRRFRAPNEQEMKAIVVHDNKAENVKTNKVGKTKIEVEIEEEEEVEEMLMCPACRREVPFSAKRCPWEDCGIDFDDDDEDEEEEENIEVEEQTDEASAVCFSCLRPVPFNATQCSWEDCDATFDDEGDGEIGDDEIPF